MTTVRDLIIETRQLVQGSIPDELSVLDTPYTPGDTHIVLRYPKKNLGNNLISVGLTTFYVLSVSTDGRTIEVLPGADGSPDAAIPASELVLCKPRHTTWNIFSSWNGELMSLSAPINGVYAFGAFSTIPNWINGTYPLPAAWDPQQPIKLLLARYRQRGHDSWQRIDAQFQQDQNTVRVYGAQPNANYLEFVFAFPFLPATSLDQDVTTLGLNEHTSDIPGLGAAANLTRSSEGRRNQLSSQGDARKAAEVPAGANLGVSRDWRMIQQSRIAEEAGRLLAQFGYWQAPDRDTFIAGQRR
jgi:hypothetical protein